MKKVSEHLGQIIVALAAIALLVCAVVVFRADLGGFFGNIVSKTTSIGQEILANMDDMDIADMNGGSGGSGTVDSNGPKLVMDQELGKTSDNPLAVESGSFTLSGTVSDKSGVAFLTVNGNPVTVESNGAWSTTLALTQNVVTEVNVVATDSEGNTTTKSGYVGYIQYIEVAVGKNAYAEEIGYSDDVTDLVIPATFQKDGEWYKVTAIAYSGFMDCTNLTSVTIPESVTKINSKAFSGCTSLASISLPSGVAYIDNEAFKNCSNLSLTSLPSGLTKIGANTFIGCTNLALTSLPAGLTSIGQSAFSVCTNLALTSLPSGLTTIYSATFNKCSNLALTSLPSGVTSIGHSAFAGCTNLALTSLPSELISIDANAFSGCKNLALTSLPSGVTSIGSSAFAGCTNLALTSLPSELTSLGDNAFEYCNGLVLTSLPAGLITIGDQTFLGCKNLALTSLPSSLTSIGRNAFRDCNNLTSVTFENTNGWYVTRKYGATSGTDVDVTDAAENATMLKSTYKDYYWYRTVSE